MKLTKKVGSTSEIWQIFIQTTAAFDGSGLTGLTNLSGSLTAYFHRDTDTTATAIALVSMTVGTFTSSGFKEIDSANMPGWYQFCPPNAALASGAKSCAFHLKGATNMAATVIEVQLTAVDPDSATSFITAVNALAPPTNWNLLSVDASGRVDLAKWIGSAPDALSSGKVPSDLKLWLTVAPNALQSGRVDSYLGAVASGVIAAASFASGALDAVWSTTARTLSTGAIVAGTFASGALDAVWATAARLLTAGTNIVLAKGVGVTGFNDLTAAQVNAEADTALADVGVTGTVTGRIDAAISSRSTVTTAQVNAEADTALADVGLTGTITGRIDAAISSRSSHTAADVAAQVTTDHGAGSYIRNTEPDNTSISAIKTQTDLIPADPADASDIAAAFASVASGLATIAGYLDTEVAAIKLKTDLIPASPAAVGDVPSAASNAAALLDASDAIETGLTPRQALRLLAAVLGGTCSGAATNTPVYRNAVADSKARVTATTDDSGDRLTLVLDLT